MVRFVITAILSIKSIPNRAMKGKTIKLPGFSLNDFQKVVVDADDGSKSSAAAFPFFFFVFLLLVTDRGAIYRNVVVVGTFSISDSPIFIIPDGIVLVLVLVNDDDDDNTGG